MNEPERLRDGQGPAATLLRGGALEVPSAARRRALSYASALAAGAVATSTATAAGATSLAKGFLVYLAVGAAGGGALSLVASTVTSALDAPRPVVSAPVKHAPAARAPQPAVQPESRPTEAAPEPQPSEPARDEQSAPPAEPPRPITSDARRVAPVASLFEEQQAIERARLAIARGDAAAALGMLDEYERSYARRQFGPEALALRVEALRHQGQLDAARARASEFERRYPRHPLLARVRERSR